MTGRAVSSLGVGQPGSPGEDQLLGVNEYATGRVCVSGDGRYSDSNPKRADREGSGRQDGLEAIEREPSCRAPLSSILDACLELGKICSIHPAEPGRSENLSLLSFMA